MSKLLTVLALVSTLAARAAASIGPVPVDVVMAGGTVFFVQEKPREIEFLRVSEPVDKTKTGAARWRPANMKVLWLLGHDQTTELKTRKYVGMEQIAYGQKYVEFSWVEGPLELQRNIEYRVELNMGSKFAKETFTITGDDAVLTSRSGSGQGKRRSYSVSVDKNGHKTLVPAAEGK